MFHKEGDYAAFVDLLAAANERLPMRMLGYVLMPNHFHLVLWPHAAGDLSRWMQWLLTIHVRRYHRHYHSSGHVWQGRFKAFPIEQDEHLLTVLRYVERNPLRAGLVERAEDWHWSSLAWRTTGQAAGDACQVAGRLPAKLDRLRQPAANGGRSCWPCNGASTAAHPSATIVGADAWPTASASNRHSAPAAGRGNTKK